MNKIGVSVLPKFSGNDLVESPEHYVSGRSIDPILVIEDWFLPHHLACALKYICRAGRKGEEILDLEKAVWYLRRRKAILENEKGGINAISTPKN